MFEYLSQHPLVVAALSASLTWLMNNVVTVMITSLPAPTKDSTQQYTYWFKVSNKFIGNYQRAKSTAIENSPNFQDAVQKAVNGNGLEVKPVINGIQTPPAVG